MFSGITITDVWNQHLPWHDHATFSNEIVLSHRKLPPTISDPNSLTNEHGGPTFPTCLMMDYIPRNIDMVYAVLYLLLFDIEHFY